jgi:hypothetical protein
MAPAHQGAGRRRQRANTPDRGRVLRKRQPRFTMPDAPSPRLYVSLLELRSGLAYA